MGLQQQGAVAAAAEGAVDQEGGGSIGITRGVAGESLHHLGGQDALVGEGAGHLSFLNEATEQSDR